MAINGDIARDADAAQGEESSLDAESSTNEYAEIQHLAARVRMGDTEATFQLARRMVADGGVDEAATLFAVAASEGHMQAVYALAMCRIMQKKYHEAFTLLKRAADAGVASSQALLGVWYMQGLHGIPKNPRLGASYLSKAAAQDNVMAIEALRDCYMIGLGVELSWARAAELHCKAAHLRQSGLSVESGLSVGDV